MELPYLQVIGNGDAFGSGGRFHTSYLVHTGNSTFLIDFGATSIIGLAQNNITSDGIDRIIISHFHGDHFGGIPFFLLDAIFIRKRTKPLFIIGPPGCKEKVTSLTNNLYPEILSKVNSFELIFEEYKMDNPLESGDVFIEALPVVHSPESVPYGLRISFNSKIVAFSGDTEWTDNLYLLSKGTDLFLCECNYLAGHSKGHLSHEILISKKLNLNTKRMLLTHLGGEMIEHSHSLEFEVSEQGKRYVI